jgi:S-adenosyl methyltransferase
MWNYWLGGKDNFAADREAAERVLEAMPSLLPTSPPKPPPRWPSRANPEHPRQLTYGRRAPGGHDAHGT